MNIANQIFFTTDFDPEFWQLPRSDFFLALITWRQATRQVDSGVPDQIADILAEAIVSCGPVSFPASFDSPSPEDARIIPFRLGWMESLAQMLPWIRPRNAWVRTAHVHTVKRLFDSPPFHWDMQATGGIVGDVTSLLDHRHLDRLVNQGAAGVASLLAELGAIAVLKPGVDGDALAFYAADEAARSRFHAALMERARAHGAILRDVESSALMSLLKETGD